MQGFPPILISRFQLYAIVHMWIHLLIVRQVMLNHYLHKNYSGEDIVLPDDPEQIIRTADHPYLLEKIGEDIITASGKTLLGADDKAGVTIIMELASYLMRTSGN